MSNRITCQGCEGKGWILVTIRETVMPYIHDGHPVPGHTRAIRDCEPRTCPVCRGEGTYRRSGATIEEAVSV